MDILWAGHHEAGLYADTQWQYQGPDSVQFITEIWGVLLSTHGLQINRQQ